MQKGYYSLVQYCPDDSRLESVNIGLVVFCPDVPNLLIRWADNINKRIRKFFGPQDWSLLQHQKDALDARLKDRTIFASRDQIDQFISTRANVIRLSPARSIKLVQVQPEFDLLFDRLVEQSSPRPRAPQVRRELHRALESNGVAGLVQQNIAVPIPVLHRQLKAAYGYQNGRFNLIQPVQFDLSQEEEALRKASLLAVQGGYLYGQPDPTHGDMRLLVVAKFGAGQQARKEAIGDIMQHHQVGLYTFDDLVPLVSDIRDSAIQHGLTSLPITTPARKRTRR